MRGNQLDAHLRAATAYLTNPADYRNAPALLGRILHAKQFAGLQLVRDVFRPGQAVTSRAVIDDRQREGRVALAGGVVGQDLLLLARLAVLDFLEGHVVRPVVGLVRIEGIGPDVRGASAGLENRGAGFGRKLEDFVERSLAGQEKVQCAHANAQGHRALALSALEGALGNIAPRGTEVLQHVQAESFGYEQARLCVVFRRQQQIFLYRIDQWGWVDAQRVVQFAALEQ
ncbi:hypothetical protein D9M68_586650 [compost metagenome]